MTKLNHKFVEFVPDTLDDGTLYVSITHGTAVHRCCCGCGREVVTPLTPTDWKLIFDGETVSLYPSIGNWNFPCRSHYWITNNRIEWAEDWSQWQIDAATAKVRRRKEEPYGRVETNHPNKAEDSKSRGSPRLWSQFEKWWSRR